MSRLWVGRLEHSAAGAVSLEDRLRDPDNDRQPFLDRGGHADGHLRRGVAISRTDATPALELPAAAPLVAHQLVDHSGWNAGVFQLLDRVQEVSGLGPSQSSD